MSLLFLDVAIIFALTLGEEENDQQNRFCIICLLLCHLISL